MFSIFKKKYEVPFPFHLLKVDMHSHLIPSIDDGATSMEESMLLIDGLWALGYEQLITSPHIMHDLYPNTPKIITDGLVALQRKIGDRTVRAAAEYFVDEYLTELLITDEPLLTFQDRFLLIELGFIAPPPGLEDQIALSIQKGYRPVIAHPERYPYFHDQLNVLIDLKAKGCLLQANLLSFSSYYGENACTAVEQLAEEGLIDLLGTDLHHQRHLEKLQVLKTTKALEKSLDKGLINAQLRVI